MSQLPIDRQTQPTIGTTTLASIDDHLLPISTFRNYCRQFQSTIWWCTRVYASWSDFWEENLEEKKGKILKHLKRGANEKDMDNFTKRVLRIPWTSRLRKLTLPTGCGYSSERPRKMNRTYIGYSIRPKRRWSKWIQWRRRAILGNLQCHVCWRELSFHVCCVTQVH